MLLLCDAWFLPAAERKATTNVKNMHAFVAFYRLIFATRYFYDAMLLNITTFRRTEMLLHARHTIARSQKLSASAIAPLATATYTCYIGDYFDTPIAGIIDIAGEACR